MRDMNQQEPKIGYVIKVLRTASGLRQKDLAQRASVKANYLSLVEAGKRDPSLKVLRAIARELNVPISLLFWESERLPKMNSEKEENAALNLRRLLVEMEALRISDQRRAH